MTTDVEPAPRRRLTHEQEVIQGQFLLDYIHKTAPPRQLFDRYLPKLGVQPILDVLEERNRFCHEEAHELGQAAYAQVKDLGRALTECGSRCSFGCLHGVLNEAFGHQRLEAIVPRLDAICRQSTVRRPGPCAHGMGHALMMAGGNDLGKALDGCLGFQRPVMAYYCQSGVFMELQSHPELLAPHADDKLWPCDTYTRFPAACYRNIAPGLVARAGGDAEAMELCRSLPHAQRLGCFFGYGWAKMPAVAARPDFFGSTCPSEPLDDATVCIEGAIEYLAVWDAKAAQRACEQLQGPAGEVCRAAATAGSYRLDKPSLPLYLGP